MFEILAKVPSVAWLGLLGVLIGSTLSLFGLWLSNASSTARLRIQLENGNKILSNNIQREKLEELYVLLGNWLNHIFNNYISQLMVMQGRLDFDQHIDLVIESGEKSKFDFNRLEMIMEIYAHELLGSYQELLTSRDELNKIATAHKLACQDGDLDGERFLKPYNQARVKLENLAESLKAKIAKTVRNV